MEKIAALSTSSPVLSVAVQSGKKITEKTFEGFHSHAENLLPAMDQILKKQKTDLSAIDTYLIDRGPGSFTGLRVGFATLQGLVTVRKTKCFGALTHDLIAEGIQADEGKNLAVLTDAFRGKIYGRIYRRVKGKWLPKTKLGILSIEECRKILPDPVYITGNAIEKYAKDLLAGSHKKIAVLPEKYWYPKAAALIKMRARADNKLRPLKKIKDFLPLYFRKSEAEERRDEKKHAASC